MQKDKQEGGRREARFMARDRGRLRRKYRPGKKLTVTKREILDDGNRKVMVKKRYTVEKAYTYHVSCVGDAGIRESFGYFELEGMRAADGRTEGGQWNTGTSRKKTGGRKNI